MRVFDKNSALTRPSATLSPGERAPVPQCSKIRKTKGAGALSPGERVAEGRVRAVLLSIVLILILSSLSLTAQDKPYSPKNGVLNLKAIILGGGFRVTTAIPLHGDFSKYDRIEIVHPESLIGSDVAPDFLDKLGGEIRQQFESGGRFREVRIINTYDPKNARMKPPSGPELDFREADDLNAPMRPASDMQAYDRQRQIAEAQQYKRASGTLVIGSQVVDYAKGNKILQLAMLDIGNAILTLRFSYYDKDTGEELGRSVISSDNSSRVIPSALSPRTVLNGIAEGLVDQITRRKVAAER